MRKRRRGCLRYFIIIIVFGALLSVFPAVKELRVGQGVSEKKNSESGENVPYQEISVEEESLVNKYYYGLLDTDEREVYKEIVQGMMAGEDEIYVHCKDAGQANRILSEVLKDYPDIFWCDGEVSSTVYERGAGSEAYTVVAPVYNCQLKEKQSRQEQIDAAVSETLQGISMDASEYEKILYVYEYIVNTVTYDLEAPDNQNIYSVFVGKRSVCAGYAKAVQYLLEQLNIPVIYATGTANGQNAHAWNLVKCDGAYYHVDSTWGDPVYQMEEESPLWDSISYDYMCCDDREVYRTHTADPEYPLPECTDMKWNYYVVNGMYYDRYDRDEALAVLNERIYEQANPTVFKYADENSYQQARDEILGDLIYRAAQNLCSIYGMEQAGYYYSEQPELCKLTVYWQY
ncbi:MAG: transglutaminase domain-containing protein [Eubacteriales bacterium]|nr:transglutaminase domain-containing protein [Eubacteriales bacterium]